MNSNSQENSESSSSNNQTTNDSDSQSESRSDDGQSKESVSSSNDSSTEESDSLDDASVKQNNGNQNEENSQTTDELVNSHEQTPKERLELLKQLRDKLNNYKEKKEQVETIKKQKSKLNGEKQENIESEEEKYEVSDETNNFIKELDKLPSFEDRDRGPGYSIDTDSYTDVPESVIRTLINKFLNQRFCKKITDLNIRSNSLEKSRGFYKWEVKDVITHLETEQITKVLTDKYGYQYAEGKNENVPLSFYFDMSGSMSEFTNMLAVIAIELLKKNVKVLIGFNERVNVQIESIKDNVDVLELASILETAGSYYSISSGIIKDSRVSYKCINRNIDNYLIEKQAEKCVVFSDFDPINEIINLSNKVQVYWFCFEDSFTRTDLKKFNGFIYKTKNIKDISNGLIKVNSNKFENLCFMDNPIMTKIRSR